MPPVQVTPLPHGPYQITGELELITQDGRVTPAADATTHLCRCGHSATKPLCDGTHARIGWEDDA